ncbi:MAG: exosome complex protein Rrp42, partial [Methermicoccaceae archaeon]
MTSEGVMAELHKDYIHGLILQGRRIDGRALDEYRDISIETGYVKKAEGSARVMLGDTQLVVGVKIQPGEPFPDTPDKGVIITNTELIPIASPS